MLNAFTHLSHLLSKSCLVCISGVIIYILLYVSVKATPLHMLVVYNDNYMNLNNQLGVGSCQAIVTNYLSAIIFLPIIKKFKGDELSADRLRDPRITKLLSVKFIRI